MKRKELAIGLLIGFVAVYTTSHFVVNSKVNTARTALMSELELRQEAVHETSNLIARLGVTTEVERLIPECVVGDMIAYDTLLSSLEKGLSHSELLRLNDLFKLCGDIAAKRRAVMALLLEKEVASLTALTKLAETSKFTNAQTLQVTKWEDLARKEGQISELFLDLVDAQESIIVALVSGVPATSVTVENIRSQAQKIREEMGILTDEVLKIRAELSVNENK
jgi:hypothetical protein